MKIGDSLQIYGSGKGFSIFEKYFEGTNFTNGEKLRIIDIAKDFSDLSYQDIEQTIKEVINIIKNA